MAFIDSGPVDATDRFEHTPKERWKLLLGAKRSFLATNLNYDCRCLVEFVEEADIVWQDLGFESAEHMIRTGYELDPVEIELAVAWLKHNEPEQSISLAQVTSTIADAVAAAREHPVAPHRRPTKEEQENKGDTITFNNRGTSTQYTLARLARDGHDELLDAIEQGDMSVNAAAIQAGYRKKKTPAELCVANFRKSENRLEPLRIIVAELEEYEIGVLKDWLTNGL